MKQFKVIAATTALLSIAATTALASGIQTSPLNSVQDIYVGSVGNLPVVTVRNVAVNKQLAKINLQPQSNTFQMKLKGEVECGGVYKNTVFQKKGYMFSEGRLGVGTIQNAYWEVAAGSSSNINKSTHAVTKTVNVPIAAFNGTAYALDVENYIMDKADQHAQNGGNKVDYLRKDHNYNVQVPIRFTADCPNYTRYKVNKQTVIESGDDFITATRMATVRIAYKGDPNLQGNAIVAFQNSQAQQGGYDAGEQNFITVSNGKFLVGPKNLKGKCALEPTFKIQIKGAGDGELKIRINDDGATIHNSPTVSFTKGKAEYSFKHTVGKYTEKQLNKTYHHNFQVYVRMKAKNDPVFPSVYKPVAGAALNWSHTCIKPIVVNPAIAGGGAQNKLYAPKPTRGPLTKK